MLIWLHGELWASTRLPLPDCSRPFLPTPLLATASVFSKHPFCGSTPKSQQEVLFLEVWWHGWITGNSIDWKNWVSHKALCRVSACCAHLGLSNFMLLVILWKLSRSPSTCGLENANSGLQQGSDSKWRLSLQLPVCIMSWALITQLLNILLPHPEANNFGLSVCKPFSWPSPLRPVRTLCLII